MRGRFAIARREEAWRRSRHGSRATRAADKRIDFQGGERFCQERRIVRVTTGAQRREPRLPETVHETNCWRQALPVARE